MNNNLQLSNLQKMHMKKINTAEKTAYKAEQFYKKKTWAQLFKTNNVVS